MNIKQSAAEAQANLKAALKKIEPAKLVIDKINLQIIDGYLELHFTGADGKVDVSFENIMQALAALHRDNQLRWEIRPKTQKDYDQEAKALNHKEVDPLGLHASFNAVKATADAQQVKEIEKRLESTQAFVLSVRGRTHSDTAAAKFTAEREFKAQLAKYKNPTLAQTVEIDKAVRRAVQEMFS
jgi:hypothetical protein